MKSSESYFNSFRKNIIGIDQTFESPYGTKKIVYADWTASGRLYRPIEEKLSEVFGPFVGNTHSDSSETGTSMTQAYHAAHDRIKAHVNADKNDVIINTGYGMTAAVNKFQRILGLKVPERCHSAICQRTEQKPVVFISHMEHHSNHTSWLHTIADVIVVKPNKEGLIDFNDLDAMGQQWLIKILTPLTADIDGDGDVDFDDYAILASQWQDAPGDPSADIFPAGGDGIVDFNDLNLLRQQWLINNNN